MSGAEKEKSGKPSGPNEKKPAKERPAVPVLPSGTKIGTGSGGIRTNVQVPILPRDTSLNPGGSTVRTNVKKLED